MNIQKKLKLQSALLLIISVFSTAVAAAKTDNFHAQYFSLNTQTTQKKIVKPRRRAAKSNKKSKNARKRTRIEVASIPTPMETVEEMLRQADLQSGDVLYDLGSGDGRIPIEAAKRYKIRSVGVEIKPQLVEAANRVAEKEGVARLAKFVHADIFRLNLREATVVTLYLSEDLNLRLLPKLLRELKPGARIVSHDFPMGSWKPDRAVRVPWEKTLYRTVYVWTVPKDKSKVPTTINNPEALKHQ